MKPEDLKQQQPQNKGEHEESAKDGSHAGAAEFAEAVLLAESTTNVHCPVVHGSLFAMRRSLFAEKSG